jgi:subtilisin family serine protease
MAIVLVSLGLVGLRAERPASTGGVAGSTVTARGSDASSDALVHADAARAFGYTGKGVTVAILDTGIDDRSPAFAGALVAEHCFVPPDGCAGGKPEFDGPGSAQDDQGHGTAIADILAGRGGVGPIGVAPDASLVVVKVADHNGRTSAAQIGAGLDWVRANHPEARVVNVSLAGDIPLSGDCSGLTASLQAYAGSVEALRAQGTTIFAASGNNGAHNGIPAPACFPGTVAVGAVYSRAFGPFTAPNVCVDATTAPDQVACFSNSSSELDLLAVGAPVDAIGLDSASSPLAGTSAAAAQAAGAAAVLLQANPQLTPDALRAVLESTGVRLTDPRSRFKTPRIDVAAALGAVLGLAVPLLPPPDLPGGVAAPPLSKPTVPSIAVSSAPISFRSVRPGQTVTRTLVVSNIGTGKLAVRVRAAPSWVSARPAKLTIDATKHRTIVFTFRPTRPGGYHGRVRLVTDDPARPTIVIGVDGTSRARKH